MNALVFGRHLNLDYSGPVFCCTIIIPKYSGNIWNSDFLKVGFQMVRFSNGLAMAIAKDPTIWKLDYS